MDASSRVTVPLSSPAGSWKVAKVLWYCTEAAASQVEDAIHFHIEPCNAAAGLQQILT